MIEQVLAGELSAKATLDSAEHGLRAEFLIPPESFANALSKSYEAVRPPRQGLRCNGRPGVGLRKRPAATYICRSTT